MNIFAIESDPELAAESMVDSHVVKMILESAQLLSTAHRVLDGKEYIDSSSGRKIKRWKLPDDREQHLYSATHINHPSSVWARTSDRNYYWLYKHFHALCKEYTYRYGKIHKCQEMYSWLCTPPKNIPIGYLTAITPVMPDEYKVPGNSVESYRNYYREGKKHLHKWTKREAPEWIGLTG